MGLKRHRRRRLRRGAQVVEFAIVAPVFILLVFGMIEFARMLMVQQILTNAAREGARVAVIEAATAEEVEAAVSRNLTGASINDFTVSVSPDPLGSAVAGEAVTVSVAVEFTDVCWIPAPRYLNGQTLHASAVMRREGTD